MKANRMALCAIVWLWTNLGQAAEDSSVRSEVHFVPQVTLMTPSEFTLHSDRVSAFYAGDNRGQPFFHVGWQRRMAGVGALSFYGAGRFGYTTRQGLHRIVLMESGRHETDSLRLHWVPLSAAIIAEYNASAFFRPYFTLGAGTHALHQSGNVEDDTRFFLIPFASTGFGVTFLNLEAGDGDTILGFSFGCSYQNTLTSAQSIRGWSLDFGFNLAL